ncbi:MAG: YaeQ family protein [Granulosicoccaceae bacterium]
MAIKPTIYKARVSLTDLNREVYDTLNLTLALHPSETPERMMARLLAYCLNTQEHLSFTKGLSDVEEPDIWARTYDEQTALWIDVGEPDFDRVKKSCRLAREVKVYSFNSKSEVWWSQGERKFSTLPAAFYRFVSTEIDALAELLERTMDLSVTVTGDSAYIACEGGEVEVHWEELKPAS